MARVTQGVMNIIIRAKDLARGTLPEVTRLERTLTGAMPVQDHRVSRHKTGQSGISQFMKVVQVL